MAANLEKCVTEFQIVEKTTGNVSTIFPQKSGRSIDNKEKAAHVQKEHILNISMGIYLKIILHMIFSINRMQAKIEVEGILWK